MPANAISPGIDAAMAARALGTGQPHCLLPLLTLPPSAKSGLSAGLAVAEAAGITSAAVRKIKEDTKSRGPCAASIVGIRSLSGIPSKIRFASESLSPGTLALLNEGARAFSTLFASEIERAGELAGAGSALGIELDAMVERGMNWVHEQGVRGRCF